VVNPFSGQLPERERFVREGIKSKAVWGLKSVKGWGLSRIDIPQGSLLLWSTEEQVRAFGRNQGSNYEPASIPLKLFLHRWLPGLAGDLISIAINWLPGAHGDHDDANKLRESFLSCLANDTEYVKRGPHLATALVGIWRSDRVGVTIGILDLVEARFENELSFRPDGTANWKFLSSEFVDDSEESKKTPFPTTWRVSPDGLLEILIPIAPMPSYGIRDWTTEALRWDVLEVTGPTLTLSNRSYDGEFIEVFKRVDNKTGLA